MRIEPKDLRVKERVALQDVIPLRTPFLMFIDVSNVCNFKCTYCPTGNKTLLREIDRDNNIMSLELFKKIVDDLKEFKDKIKIINLYADGESLINPNFPEMVEYLKDANVTERIWVKSNGYLLNPELNSRIIDAGLDMLGISISHVSQEGYRKISRINIDYEKLIENIADFYNKRNNCKVYIKIADSGLTPEETDKFYHDFESISDYIGIEHLHNWTGQSNTDFTLGTSPLTFDGLPLVDKEVCVWPFYTMAVKSSGVVSVCNEDWKSQIIVGDSRKESMASIWNGKKLHDFQILMLEGRRCEQEICSNCYYIKCSPDNLDAYKEQLLERIR